MNSTPVDLILGQSYLHLLSYGLVMVVLFAAVADAFLIRQLKKALCTEGFHLRQGELRPASWRT